MTTLSSNVLIISKWDFWNIITISGWYHEPWLHWTAFRCIINLHLNFFLLENSEGRAVSNTEFVAQRIFDLKTSLCKNDDEPTFPTADIFSDQWLSSLHKDGNLIWTPFYWQLPLILYPNTVLVTQNCREILSRGPKSVMKRCL